MDTMVYATKKLALYIAQSILADVKDNHEKAEILMEKDFLILPGECYRVYGKRKDELVLGKKITCKYFEPSDDFMSDELIYLANQEIKLNNLVYDNSIGLLKLVSVTSIKFGDISYRTTQSEDVVSEYGMTFRVIFKYIEVNFQCTENDKSKQMSPDKQYEENKLFDFSHALDLMKNGAFIRRRSWSEGLFYFKTTAGDVHVNCTGTPSLYTINVDDILADDWEVYEFEAITISPEFLHKHPEYLEKTVQELLIDYETLK